MNNIDTVKTFSGKEVEFEVFDNKESFIELFGQHTWDDTLLVGCTLKYDLYWSDTLEIYFLFWT